MAVNPLGFVEYNDFGNPRVVTGHAMEVISGGQFVSVSGASDGIGSGISSIASTDVKFFVSTTDTNVAGVATQNTASGTALGAVVDGMVIMRAGEDTTNGQVIMADAGADSVEPASAGSEVIGRAYSTGTSGNYVLVNLRI